MVGFGKRALVSTFILVFLATRHVFAQGVPQRPPTLSVNTWLEVPASDPTVDIFIDGKQYPDSLITNLAVDTHTIRCNKRGYFDYEETFDFPNKTTIQCNMRKTTNLSIKVKDEVGNKFPSRVYIDDRFEGMMDEGTLSVTKGPHTVRCAKEGYKDYSTTLDVAKYIEQQGDAYYSVECVLKKLSLSQQAFSPQKSVGFFERVWQTIVGFLTSIFSR